MLARNFARLAATSSRVALRAPRVVVPARTYIKKYTKEHEWVAYDPKTKVASMSITEYAQSSLGDVVFVELPAVGKVVAKAEQIGAVESVKAASDIYAPMSGTIIGVNHKLGEQPGLLNKDPEGDGWLCKMKVDKPEELDGLLTKEEYVAHCETSGDGH